MFRAVPQDRLLLALLIVAIAILVAAPPTGAHTVSHPVFDSAPAVGRVESALRVAESITNSIALRDQFRAYDIPPAMIPLQPGYEVFLPVVLRGSGAIRTRHDVTQIALDPALPEQAPDLSTSRIGVADASGDGVAQPREVLTYTITITNSGDYGAAVVLTDTLPPNLSFVDGSLRHDFPPGAVVTVAGHTLLAHTAGYLSPPVTGSLQLSATAMIEFAARVVLQPFRVGMVSEVTGIDDLSFNQATWAGLERADEQIEEVYAAYLEPGSDADYEPYVATFAGHGYDLIITVGFALNEATANVASLYPDTMFAIVDFNYDPPIPNVQGIVFNSDEAAFLAGYLAAGMAVELDPDDPQIGWVGGMQIPPVQIFIAGYEGGMDYYNAQKGTGVAASGTYVGNFVAPEEGQAAANTLMDAGVDIVFGVGGLTGNGALVAVRERSDAGAPVAGIGVDMDQYYTLPEERSILLTSVMKRLDNAAFTVVQDALAGDFQGGGVYTGTLANEGVGLAPYHDWDGRVPAGLRVELEAVRAGIIDGSIDTGWR